MRDRDKSENELPNVEVRNDGRIISDVPIAAFDSEALLTSFHVEVMIGLDNNDDIVRGIHVIFSKFDVPSVASKRDIRDFAEHVATAIRTHALKLIPTR